MKFKIDRQIFEKFKGVNIGLIVAKNINNTVGLPEIEDALKREEDRIRGEYQLENFGEYLKIEAWRKAYAEFGAKPKDNRSSIENLYRLILEGVNLRHVNNLVDSYNLVSIKHMLPVGRGFRQNSWRYFINICRGK